MRHTKQIHPYFNPPHTQEVIHVVWIEWQELLLVPDKMAFLHRCKNPVEGYWTPKCVNEMGSRKGLDWRGRETYLSLHFIRPLLHQVSTVFPCATVLWNIRILHVWLVFREHVLPATTHNHLPLETNRNLFIHLFWPKDHDQTKAADILTGLLH